MLSKKRRWPSAKRMSKARVDLPEPLRPVTTTMPSRGMSTEIFLRLCSRAPRTRILRERSLGGRGRRGSSAMRACWPARMGIKKRPVCEASTSATFSGVPAATIKPPSVPPSGPISMTQSAHLMTSKLCSMTMTLFPSSTRRLKTLISRATSSK